MNKRNLKAGAILHYVGRVLDRFNQEALQVKFLGYDADSWNRIWVEYLGAPRLVFLSDILVVDMPEDTN